MAQEQQHKNPVANGDDTVTYKPELCTDEQRDQGSYQVTIPYEIEDSDDAITDSANIIITVICNQRPEPNDDDETTREDEPVTVSVLPNDTDPEDDPISVNEITKQPEDGTATTDGTTITYTPRKEKCDEIAGMQIQYTVTIDYNIIDGSTAQLVSKDSARVIYHS